MLRNLVLVFGDQLAHTSAAFDQFDARVDRIWMAEVHEELTHVWCHKLRIAFFLSAMRHFRDELLERGWPVLYRELPGDLAADHHRSFAALLGKDLPRLKPEKVVVTLPGDYRVRQEIEKACEDASLPLEVRTDRHFLCDPDEFQEYARDKKKLVLEMFYRHMRKKHRILLERNGEPAGGSWNFDRENRMAFRKAPEPSYTPLTFPADALSREVMGLVETRFADHPGSLEHFQLPVCGSDARTMLKHFVEDGLPSFGTFQDAMWTNQPFLYHSRLSALLNMKLLDPRECIEMAVAAYECGVAPLNSVEGFVRQILGWREFVRGMYWLQMPEYAEKNYFEARLALPEFYWNGETDTVCMRETMKMILDHGYAHHIHRLMVAGLFALLYGVDPREFHEWHMAMYLDAIDWVSLPNALGMSQYGDGGIVGTKPYCASGHYIHRMSNFCERCRYKPGVAVGADACPFTMLYWDFLDRNYEKLRKNPRLKFQVLQLERKRKNAKTLVQIREQARKLRRSLSRRDQTELRKDGSEQSFKFIS